MPFMLSMLGKLRGIRGTWLDPFKNSEERKLASICVHDTRPTWTASQLLNATNAQSMTRLAAWPVQVRGLRSCARRQCDQGTGRA
jgi:indolepyruvate ferredoxin oxidoreductase